MFLQIAAGPIVVLALIGLVTVVRMSGMTSLAPPRPKAEANAQLITAAPELLAALQAFTEETGRYLEDDELEDLTVTAEIPGAMIAQARAAIDKATTEKGN